MKNKIIATLIEIFLIFFFWYFMLPPLNITSPEFWTFLFTISIITLIVYLPNLVVNLFKRKRYSVTFPKFFLPGMTVFFSIVALIFFINIFFTPLFNSQKYANRITVDDTRNFTEDISPVDFTKIPLLDKISSQKLGDRKMGQATEWVSQYYVSDLYTQINFNDSIIRVTPIKYADIIKYFTNRKDGIKGYITVDSVTGEAELVKLNEGMKYMPSAHFFENLYRYLRLKYPTTIFDEASFEIDNEGNPYWIVPTVKYAGIGLRKEVSGVIIVSPITGECQKYSADKVPSWVDHVYSASLIIEELDDWGSYKDGFWNSLFGQKNVVNTTEGYNYLVLNDDVYLYTGITSVSTDESNLGFVLVNMRTKETHYYSAPGAEEYSAMASAEGLVQEKGYEASFPLLINLNNKPTYLLSLKDAAGLVKMYAFVDVADYQKVVVSDASLGIEVASQKYLSETKNDITESAILTKEITIKEISTVVMDGNTYYYITDTDDLLYVASIKINSDLLPFIKVNDKVKINYQENKVNNIVTIGEI